MRPVYRIRVTADDVGSRVSLRARTGAAPGEPGLSDTVGVLVAWDDDVLVVERRDGSTARVPAGDLVAGRVIPPAPPRRPGRARDASG